MKFDASNAVKDGGNFDILRKRLTPQSSSIKEKLDKINKERMAIFGGSSLSISTDLNLATDSSCTPVDISRVGNYLILGIEKIKNTIKDNSVDNILSVYLLEEADGITKATKVPYQDTFFGNTSFVDAISNMLNYNKEFKFRQINQKDGKLNLVFTTNEGGSIFNVFSFDISGTEPKYIGSTSNQPEKENCDVSWTRTTDKDHVKGINPHISIADKLFVSTASGKLVIKSENDTGTAIGVYSEDLKNKYQNISDAEINYSDLGDIVLLQILPLQERNHRYYVYNCITQEVLRSDNIGDGIVYLPENQGIIFSNGFSLSSGKMRTFSAVGAGFYFEDSMASPNGEDFIYSFFNRENGLYAIYHYNLIDKNISSPIVANSSTFSDNGTMFVYRDISNGTHSQLHKLQLWDTPFMSPTEFSKSVKVDHDNELYNIGNASLVRGISDINTLLGFVSNTEVSVSLYEALIKQADAVIDDHHWLKTGTFSDLKSDIDDIKETSTLVLSEFKKVKVLALEAEKQLEGVQKEHASITHNVNVMRGDSSERLIKLLGAVKEHIGKLTTSKETRYIDTNRIDEMISESIEGKDKVVDTLISLLQTDAAFAPFNKSIDDYTNKVKETTKVVDLNAITVNVDALSEQLSSLNSEVSEVDTKDSTSITKIITSLSVIFGKLNTLRSRLNKKIDEVSRVEAKNEFAAQFKQLGQLIDVAKNNATSPSKCDEELSKLNISFENLESRFSQFDDYIEEISAKRNEIYTAFETLKTQLVSSIQRKIDNTNKAARISLDNIKKRVERFDSIDKLNAYFNTDMMVDKVNQYSERIRDLGDSVAADSLVFEIKNIKDLAVRDIRDRSELFDDNGNLAKLGKHRFSVNKKPLDLNITFNNGKPYASITSTDFLQPIESKELAQLSEYFEYDTPVENREIYRAEMLAYQFIKHTEISESITSANLAKALNDARLGSEKELISMITNYISSRYREGYVQGIHDLDAAKIIQTVYPLYNGEQGQVVSTADARVEAIEYLLSDRHTNQTVIGSLNKKGTQSKQLDEEFNTLEFTDCLISDYSIEHNISLSAAKFLLDCSLALNSKNKEIYTSKEAFSIVEEVNNKYDSDNFNKLTKSSFSVICRKINPQISELITQEAWLLYEYSFLRGQDNIFTPIPQENESSYKVDGLIGDHPLIIEGSIQGDMESFISRCERVETVHLPNYERFSILRQQIANQQKEDLQINDFVAKPISSFVRNRLIKESYLPFFGSNLAKQMGAFDNPRTDQSGMLLLLSPPGYGKTTLVEYIAKTLGMVFVKVNCPSIGSDTTSIIADENTDAAAKKELDKINMALEMGNNTLLYLDDIQHTNPELLQKFISLCDGTRRMEGQWDGVTKTYDMRGKRFSIVMAGNPYTESGEAFRIPDMLANRADIYNLGDVLSGQEDIFELSYIENSITSNSVLSPLSSRSQSDTVKLVRMAKGEDITIADLEHNYSPTEADEIVKLLSNMLKVQDVVLRVNKEYIRSAAIASQYRTEPAFLLQGSYRNMNKMAEQLSSVMTDKEVDNLIYDHYRSESQTLTSGAEENMLRFKEIIGKLTDEELLRWEAIKLSYAKNGGNGEPEVTPESRMAAALENILGHFRGDN